MSIKGEMIKFLPKIKHKIMNPFFKELPQIFEDLKLEKDQLVLDIPCGRGGVSIPLAKKYKVKVIGYDILIDYIKSARAFAQENKVSDLCAFEIKDIRSVVKERNIYDVLLWIAAPTIWKSAKETIHNLRKCVKNQGIVIIGDAYVYKPTNKYPDYKTLEETNRGHSFYGDTIIEIKDYKNKLWKEDYINTKKPVYALLNKIKNLRDKNILQRYLKHLDKEEKTDTKHLGLAIWIIRVNKS